MNEEHEVQIRREQSGGCQAEMETEIALVLIVLAATIVLFVTERLRVDVIALLIMLTISWLGLVSPLQAFSGFASNAVISIIGVMIIGYGIDRTGVMNRLSRFIISVAGSSERRLIATVCSVVGVISGFMQNIGSAALFLPAMMRISRQTTIPSSRLLMPMGFAAILGGTLTMVGSGPLILLNDLLIQGGFEPFGLFAVTPIGFALLAAGIVYFLIFGRRFFPRAEGEGRRGAQEYLIETWALPTRVHRMSIPETSRLMGKVREDIPLKDAYHLHLLAVRSGDDLLFAPWRYTAFAANQDLFLLGSSEDALRFAQDYGLNQWTEPSPQPEMETAGFAEIAIRPRARIAGKTFREITFRKHYGVEPIVLISRDIEEREDFSDRVLAAGDIIVVYGPWNRIRAFSADPDFMLFTSVEGEPIRKSKAPIAVLCFLCAIALTFTGVQISLAFLSGAIAMVLTGVITIDEAYRAIDWRTVFLLAGLIPLGIAIDGTGAAAYIAGTLMLYLQGSHTFLILLGIGVLTTFFSLFMSNVAATVLLVPLVLIIGEGSGIDPRGLAMLVGICASNSFILPTHQVNAFLMAPGGYRNIDYIKAGGVMTVIFLVAAVGLIYILFV
jgi:di/tricarboxylate transporter